MSTKNLVNLAVSVAVVGIVSFLIQAIIAGGFLFTSVMGIVSFIVFILVVVLFVRKQRSQNGGVISFKDAFLLSFLGLLIGGIISSVFTLLYVQFVDPGYVDRIVMMTLESTQGFMEGSMGDEQMEQIMREQEASMREGFQLSGIFKTLGYSAIVYAIISLIIAAIMKRSPQMSSSETLDS